MLPTCCRVAEDEFDVQSAEGGKGAPHHGGTGMTGVGTGKRQGTSPAGQAHRELEPIEITREKASDLGSAPPLPGHPLAEGEGCQGAEGADREDRECHETLDQGDTALGMRHRTPP